MSDLKTQYKAKLDEARAITAKYTNGSMPAEEAKKVEAILGSADELKVQIDLAGRLAAGDAYMSEPAGTLAAHHGWRDAGQDEGMAPVDAKSWREVEVKMAWGETRVYRFNIPAAVEKKGYGPAFESYLRNGKEGLGPTDRKTLSEGVDSAGGFLVPED
jgi:HK97 family phage major capsid protein